MKIRLQKNTFALNIASSSNPLALTTPCDKHMVKDNTMASSSSHQAENPERLKTLACDVKFPGRNTLLHRFVLDNSDPNDSGSRNYVNAVLLSISDVPANVVNALNDDGYSALHLAVDKNNQTMVKKLISCLFHVDVNARCGRGDENTALHLAVESGHASIVRELFNKGASINITNRYAETALSVAMRLRALDIVKILVSADVNQHTRYDTPLHEAAQYRSLEIVEFLIDRGADLEARGSGDGTPLHNAVEMGNLDIVKLLIGKGADLHATDEADRTPLHHAALFGISECAAFLIDQGSDVNARDLSGLTPLHDAASGGNIDIAKWLIDKGADLHARCENGRTPLHDAVYRNKLECAAFLLGQGADFHADGRGWTPLHTAAYEGQADIVRALLDRGADVHAKNRGGETPLDLARERQNQFCMDVLENVR